MTRKVVSPALRDALFAGSAIICAGALFAAFDTVERLIPTLTRYEPFELDELLLTAGLVAAASSWFALRRWRESAAQLAALRSSEREKARYVQRLEELSAELLSTEERERTRLSELLHDDVGQTLYACGLKLDALASAVRDPGSRRLLDDARGLAGAALERTRELTSDLSPPVLHDLGLAEAVEWLLDRLEQRYAMRPRMAGADALAAVPQRLHAPIFHSLGELLVNACKHAAASEITITAQSAIDGELRIYVRDDGCGFDPTTAREGFGLLSVERRMACLQGALEIRSALARGTTATLRFAAERCEKSC